MAEHERMYSDLAWTWPIISPKEDYVEEAEILYALLEGQAKIGVGEILHLGCGGGHIDYSLKARVRLTGVDLSAAMLGLAQVLNPEVEYLQGDMRSIRLGKQFDGVFVADSIDYMLTEADLRRAFETAFIHLRPGGVFCTYSESRPERFEQNATFGSTHKSEGVEVAFIENTYDPDPLDTTYELTYVYLIRRKGQLSIETDRHVAGIFPLSTWSRALADTGFEVHTGEFGEEKLPLFICLKPL